MPKARVAHAGAALCFTAMALGACTSDNNVPEVAAAPRLSQPVLTAPAGACEELLKLALKDVEITAATPLAEGASVPKSEMMPMFGQMAIVARGLPAFCRVVGHVRPEQGSDIGFEVWLPTQWDGRLHGVGIGGFAGGIDYLTMGLAVKAGQATVATNTGHSGTMMDSAWAKGHPERVRDYGWRAVHQSTLAAKDLIAAFYGRRPDKSYFIGCSGGGRQGLVEASRFPEDYDGIIAGAPAASWTNLAIAMVNPIQAQLAPGSAIRPAQVKFLQAEVLRQCDAKDGQVDGLVADARQCKLDYSKLECGNANSDQCFTPSQLRALKRIHDGSRDSRGRQLVGGYLPSGSEAGTPSPQTGWEGYLLQSPSGQTGGVSLVGGLFDNFVQTPFASAADFDFDKDPALLRKALSQDLDASPDLGRFFARGGKLIMWHGWADAAIPPQNTLMWHREMLRQSGPGASSQSRLFMVPGVQHCMGGTGPDSFGQLNAPQPGEGPDRSMVAALQAWVEGTRSAPVTFVARRGHGGLMGAPHPSPERQRLLCEWPRKSVLRAGADPDLASSYTCK